nr:hypothetical protein [uncultured Draconibacterium sp.]
MAYQLKNVVPWGRNLDEYISMFNLTSLDRTEKIISFGDGPASFNSEMTKRNGKVISIDPLYQFSSQEIKQRIDEIKGIVIEQTKNNTGNFVWRMIKNVKELEQIRLSAMAKFLQDFENGKKEKRYINHELPNKTEFDDLAFDLGLSSHFLLLYSQLGLDFHIASIAEMLRISKEIRIFPILNLDAKKSELLADIIEYFGSDFVVNIQKVNYEFQKNGNEMLKIKRR